MHKIHSVTRRVSIVLVAIFALSAVPARAAVIFQDNFDTEATGASQTLNLWTVSSGDIDVVGVGYVPALCAGSGSPTACVDLDGSMTTAGTIVTAAFALVSGQSYTLSFWLGNNPVNNTPINSMTVSIGSAFSEAFTAATQGAVSRTFLYSGVNTTAALQFAHAGGDTGGLILDDVLLETSSNPPPPNPGVPEPATLALLTIGGLAWRLARRDGAGR